MRGLRAVARGAAATRGPSRPPFSPALLAPAWCRAPWRACPMAQTGPNSSRFRASRHARDHCWREGREGRTSRTCLPARNARACPVARNRPQSQRFRASGHARKRTGYRTKCVSRQNICPSPARRGTGPCGEAPPRRPDRPTPGPRRRAWAPPSRSCRAGQRRRRSAWPQ